jgi:hypothetical protein
MSHTSTSKRAKFSRSHGVGHGGRPYTVPSATLEEFLATYRFTPKRYAAFVKKFFGDKPELLKRTG